LQNISVFISVSLNEIIYISVSISVSVNEYNTACTCLEQSSTSRHGCAITSVVPEPLEDRGFFELRMA